MARGATPLPPKQRVRYYTELQPPRAGARPKTTTAVARRLIGNALGVTAAVRCPKAEAELAEARRRKREERRARHQGQAEAWGDGDA